MLYLGVAAALIHLIIAALRDEKEKFVCRVLNLNAKKLFFSYGFNADSPNKSQAEHLRFKAFWKLSTIMLVVLSSDRVRTFAILFINIKANFEMSNSLLEIQDIHWVLQMPLVILLLLSKLQFS